MAEKKKGFFGEFKEFITKGNVLDMAVGVIVGSCFTKIINSMVGDILMPIISLVNPGGFSKMYVGIGKVSTATEDVTLANGVLIKAGDEIYQSYIYYGNFIEACINFVLIALVLFCIVKAANKVRAKNEAIKANQKEKIEQFKNKNANEAEEATEEKTE